MEYTVFQVKGYLTICGLSHNATQGAFEQWIGKSRSGRDVAVQLCVSETSVPTFSINAIVKEMEDTHDRFVSIVSVIT